MESSACIDYYDVVFLEPCEDWFTTAFGDKFHHEDSCSDYEPSNESDDEESDYENDDDDDNYQLPEKFPTDWRLLSDCNGENCEENSQLTYVNNFEKCVFDETKIT